MPILHRTRTFPALVPRCVSRFSCIGPECEDNCCTGWHVAIDKKTFKAYRNATQADLGKLFAKTISRRPGAPDDFNYGQVELNAETRECPLLEERLCAVQKKLDESHLSHTCFSYPRVTRDFGGQLEQALLLSCPEAARQALLAPDAFDFVEGTVTVRMDVVTAITEKHGIPLELMNELRIFCLKLLRSEGLELWQRLAVLGVCCERLGSALADGKHATLPALLDSFVALVEQGLAAGALAGMQPNIPAQAMVFCTLWGGKKVLAPSAVQRKVIDAIASGLGADPGTGRVAAEKLVDSYTRGLARLPEALEATPHLLEHYLLNEMFSNLFPFDAANPFDSYLQLVSRFGLLRLMLAAQCNTDGPLPDAPALVQTVQVYCRRFQHDSQFAEQANQALKNSGWGTLEKLYGFLRT